MLMIHSRSKKVLCISGRPDVRKAVEEVFPEDSSYALLEASGGQEGTDMALSIRPDLIMIDLGAGRFNGLETAQNIRRLWPEAKIIMMGEYSDPFRISWG